MAQFKKIKTGRIARTRKTTVRKVRVVGKKKILPKAENYRHTEAEVLLRPDVGTQPQFKKKKPAVTYRYDSSLAPSMEWDGQNSVRDLGEWLISLIEKAVSFPAPHTFDKPQEFRNSTGQVVATVRNLQEAVDQLKRIEKPFLNWAGKAERLSFDVPTLPLFVHERLSTKGIIETLKGHRKDEGVEQGMLQLFGDPQHSITDQVLKAYEYKDKWVNRMILGDSLVVMNSLLHYEGLGGQVQMIYIDPPYGIKFGSNFQPFVRKKDVAHNDDRDMTREPEMVQAYRDTWVMGLHSYLSYFRDRLLLARELLSDSGSLFVQIGDVNLHHLRELMDEVMGHENFVAIITFQTAANQNANTIQRLFDHLIWYSKDTYRLKVQRLYRERTETEIKKVFPRTDENGSQFKAVELDGLKVDEIKRLKNAGRITSDDVYAKLFPTDFPQTELHNVWTDTVFGHAKAKEKIYAVQTNKKVIERCLLMTTAPGDLVLDPTCGGGTTAFVAEQWGRRWITIDVSRVPLALARQRVLTATFPYYQLKDEARGPAGGFDYQRRQNNKGEEVGGIVPHVTLESLANDEPPKQEVLVDRPESVSGITRVTGPFCFEATIPTPVDWEEETAPQSDASKEHVSFVERMLEVLRRSPVLHLGNGKTVELKNIKRPAGSLSLSAVAGVEATAPGQKPTLTEAIEEAEEKRERKLPLSIKSVAILFGPENGAIIERSVKEAAEEAKGNEHSHLYLIGFAIQPNARKLIDNCHAVMGIPATYIQATPDLMMGDLLKNMRSSQIFSVCGLPEVKLRKTRSKSNETRYQVELLGLDVLDPITMQVDHRKGDDVPAWFLDTDYNGLCFHVCQAFFPRTSAWDNLKRSLKGLYADSVWDHLAGTKSAPFEAGEQGQVAVKVIDDRGNELIIIKKVSEAEE